MTSSPGTLGPTTASPTPELEEERDLLLQALADLEEDRGAGIIDEGDYQVLRDGYTARAAVAIRALSRASNPDPTSEDHPDGPKREPGTRRRARQSGTNQSSPDQSGTRSRPARRRRVLWALSVCGVVGLALALAFTFSAVRLPGQTTSGSATLNPAQKVVQELAQGRRLAAANQDLQAIQAFSQALSIDPRQPEALAYRGWLERLAGVAGHNARVMAVGKESVQAAISADPNYPDAHAFMGYILLQDAKDPAGAVAQFRLFLADSPDPAMVSATRTVVAQAFEAVGLTVPPAANAKG
ncbi:MAG: tetratricopeptide repeat protein [Acidimicrobiales bacterium]